ncbi:WD40-repeat-containing domain, partial [Trinorchestia longiramus]
MLEAPQILKLSRAVPPSRLLATSCTAAVYDIAFPKNTDDLFVTAGGGGIRVWCLSTQQELLRHSLPGLVALACAITHDRSTIVVGWDDGRLSGVGAESGQQLWCVKEAHQGPLTALVTLAPPHFVTGGQDGK